MKREPGLSFALRWSMFLRLLLLQASWNPQRMQNLGLLYCLLAWLRRQRTDTDFRRHFFRRYYEFFNTNPYLAGFLAGGLARLEADRRRGAAIPRQMLRTYRDSLGRTFASLGDQLFWLGLKPALTLIACLLALRGSSLAALALFVVFGVCQLGLRWWSLGVGFGSGMEIPGILAHPLWHAAIRVIKRTALVAMGLAGGVFAARYQCLGGGSRLAVFGMGIALGLLTPLALRRRLPGEIMLLIGFAVCLGLGFAISPAGG